MSVINRYIVLKLNRVWQPVGFCSVKKAIGDLAAGLSAYALDFEYTKDENGNYILDEDGRPVEIAEGYPLTVDWETWTTLSVRPWETEDGIRYCNGNKLMRAPTVLIAKNFATMPKKTFRGKPSKEAIWIRDGGVDQYTGKKLRRENATVDHVKPQSKGGRDTWENLVITDKDINSKKGNLSNDEAGLKLIRQPVAPRPMPLSSLIREVKHPTWRKFLTHIDD